MAHPDDTLLPETRWFGTRPITLAPGDAVLGLSEGIAVEWKDFNVRAGASGGVRARPVTQDGIDAVEVDMPGGTGWIRLRVDLPCAAEDRLTGLRVLMRLVPRGGGAAAAAPFKAYAGRLRHGGLHPIEAGMARIAYLPGSWHNVTAALIRPGGEEGHAAILELPENHVLTLALVETADHAVRFEPAARRPLATEGLVALRPFRADRLTADEARSSAAHDPVFAADAEIRGSELCGWAVTGRPAGIVIRGGHGAVIEAATGLETELRPGIRAACGFAAGTLPLPDGTGAGRLTCHLRTGPEAEPGPAFLTLSAGGPGAGATLRDPPQATGPVLAETGSILPLQAPVSPAATALFTEPDASTSDPYQRLLYRALRGIAPRPGGLSSALAHLADPDADSAPVVHLTALGPLLASAKDPEAAMETAREIAARLTFLVHRGGQVIWTLRAPPEGPWPEAERALGQAVAALRGPVHLHCDSLVTPLSAAWEIEIAPDRRLVTPLGGSVGHYPDYARRAAARARLGLDEAMPLFLVYGRLDETRDIDAAVRAFAAVRTRHPEAHLLIHGQTAPGDSRGRVRRLFDGRPHVRVIEADPAGTSLQWIFRAADWAVMPCRADHTPEALVTAMSFGLPVIAPDHEVITRILPEGAGLLYDADSPDGPEQSLFQALAVGREAARTRGEAARRAMAARSWTPTAEALHPLFHKRIEARDVTLDFEDRPRRARLLGAAFPPERVARTAIVILNYETCEDTARLCASLREGTDRDFDLYVVDNGSPSVTEDELIQRFGNDRILRLPENLGYAAGNNAALRLIAGLDYRHVLILNPDLTAPPDALERLVAAAEAHDGPAVFGPALLRGGDAGRVASAGCFIDTSAGLATGHMYAGESAGLLPEAPYEADFVTGAAMFFSRATLDRIGLLPEAYFLYFEESDWLTRARSLGVPSIVLPDIRLQHHKRSEAGGLPAPYFFYYYIRNARIFLRRLADGDPDSAADPDIALARLRAEFITPHLDRIRRAAPDRLGWFTALADRALADGEAGRTGPVDLLAGGLPGDGLIRPGADIVTGLKVRLVADGDAGPRIAGTLSLPAGGASTGPWHLAAVHRGTVLASREARREEGDPADCLRIDMPLPGQALAPGRGQTVTLYLNGQKTGSVSAYIPEPRPVLDGKFVSFGNHCCTGWLRNRAAGGRPVVAEIWSEGRILGRGLADLPVNQGACGFSIRLPHHLADGTERLFELRAAGDGTVIAEAALSDRIGQKSALNAQPEQVMAELFYRQELWFGGTDPEASRAVAHLRRLTAERRAALPAAAGPGVTVALPVGHGDSTDDLRAAIDSVLAQSHGDWELRIVAQDARLHDGVTRLLGPDPDPRIRLLPSSRTLHTRAEARNLALAGTDRPVIAHIHPGSTWDRDYLAIQIAALDEAGAEAVVCGQWLTQEVLGADGRTPVREVIGLRGGQPTLPRLENRPGPDLAALVMRRAIHDRLGGFDPALPTFEDWDLMLRLADIAPLPAVPALLVTCDIGPAPLRRLEDPARRQGLERIGITVDRIAARFGTEGRAAPARPIDIAILLPDPAAIAGPDPAARIARRLRDIASILPDPAAPTEGGRVMAVLPPGLAAPVRRALSDAPCEMELHETGSVQAGNASFDALEQALSWRRDGADLLLTRIDAVLSEGTLTGLWQAAKRRPRAGILVPRHSLGGREKEARSHVPSSWRERDVCIAISHRRANLLDPGLDPVAGLALLSAPDPFCLCLMPEVARAMAAAEAPEEAGDLDSLLGARAAEVCLALDREIVYCGRARAFEMPF